MARTQCALFQTDFLRSKQKQTLPNVTPSKWAEHEYNFERIESNIFGREQDEQ